MSDQVGDFNRRSFLKGAAFVGAGSLVPGKMAAMAQNKTDDKKSGGAIPRRTLGKTGIEVSAIGMGGYHLGSAKTQKDAVEMVARAIDAGITFFDNAWDYHDGQSEEYLGQALKGKRDRVVLMTKVCTHGRSKDVAMQQLEQSLRRLQTDHLDVWQIHEVIYDNDPDLIFAPGGAIEALSLAKQQGKVRAVGFTGHKDPRIHLKMLSHDFPFDTVQMPLNCLDATFHSFEMNVLPELQKRGIAPLGMKSMGGSGEIVTHGAATPEEALRYAMSLPVATTISGMESMEVLEQNIAIASNFKLMSAPEMQALRDKVKFWASDGRFERFKTTKMYDGAEGRKQHEYPPVTELPA